MVKTIAGLAILLAVPGMLGAPWEVCVDDGASLLKAPVRGAMLKEFQAILGGHTAKIEFGRCDSGGARVTLKIKPEPPPALKGVLGLAYREGNRIAPDLQVFYGPLIRYLGKPNNALAVGRALARVAAHEVGHFLDQRAHHCPLGLMRSGLPAYELSAKDRWPFRLVPGCGNDEIALAEPPLHTEVSSSQ